jgi:hypothetical protein
MKGFPLAHCEPVTLVTPPDAEKPWVQSNTPKLPDVIAAARPNQSDTESQELVELFTEHKDIFAMNSNDYRRTDSVPPYRYGRGPTDSLTPKEAPSRKKGGSRRK